MGSAPINNEDRIDRITIIGAGIVQRMRWYHDKYGRISDRFDDFLSFRLCCEREAIFVRITFALQNASRTIHSLYFRWRIRVWREVICIDYTVRLVALKSATKGVTNSSSSDLTNEQDLLFPEKWFFANFRFFVYIALLFCAWRFPGEVDWKFRWIYQRKLERPWSIMSRRSRLRERYFLWLIETWRSSMP